MKKRATILIILISCLLAATGIGLVRTRTPHTVSYSSDQVKSDLTNAHNLERNGLPRLRRNAKLDRAAQKHAEWMARNHKLSHAQPFGRNLGYRVQAEGYDYRAIGENIAAGHTSVRGVMKSWMNSDGHRNNILGNYKEIGIGIAVDEERNTTYWVVDFGSSLR